MRLLIDDTFATSTLTHPIAAGDITLPAGLDVSLVPRLPPEMVGAQDAALIASPAVLYLQDTHLIAPELAVVAQDTGSAIRGAVRADYFVGSGAAAGDIAGRLKQNLRLWVLWPR